MVESKVVKTWAERGYTNARVQQVNFSETPVGKLVIINDQHNNNRKKYLFQSQVHTKGHPKTISAQAIFEKKKHTFPR